MILQSQVTQVNGLQKMCSCLRSRIVKYYSVDQKSGYCRRSSLTVDRIENLMAHYEVQLLILSTGAPFRLKIPTYLSKRIFFKISESGLQNKKFIE